MSLDTDRDIEDLQIAAWRVSSTIDIARVVAGASAAARQLALAGLRTRYPDADEREIIARFAGLTLGHDVARRAYPELDHLDP